MASLLDPATNNQRNEQCFLTQALPSVTTTYSKLPEIMMASIKLIYTGTIMGFFTFFFQLCECCSICHFWAPATQLHDIDLLTHFANIDLNNMLKELNMQWTPTFRTQIYQPGSLTCASQLFYQVLTTSIKVNIRQEVSQRLHCFPTLEGDGTAFWLCLTHIVFPNTQIFTLSIKTQIWQLTLQSCVDINDYIMQIEDLIQLLGPYPMDKLLPNLFQQFKTVPCYYFHKAIVDLEQDYYLGCCHNINLSLSLRYSH